MLVLKFGGTSVGSPERMKALVPLIVSSRPKIVVLSAMSGTTNSLVAVAGALYAKENDKARDLIGKLEEKYRQVVDQLYSKEETRRKGQELVKEHFSYLGSFTIDLFTANEEKAILAQGELLSTALMQFYLEETGVRSVLLPALNFMRIDENDEPDLDYIEKHLQDELKKHPGETLFITQGYICRNAFGEIDNLKRGGSDYTATLIGAALRSEEVQIWTDIDGMHNNDPRIVDKTFPIHELTFDEAAELAYFGAKILHPTCVLPAQKRNVPVALLNTMQPQAKGTIIGGKVSGDRITAVAAKDGIAAIKIRSARMLLAYGFLRSVFEVFERYKTPIDMITTSEVAVSLTIDNLKHLGEIVDELKTFGNVDVDREQTIVCIVGTFGKEKQGYASRVFDALRNIPIRMISYGGSENNISILIDTARKKEALAALNKGLFNL
ncbi:MAG TPA: aspartate kinase [Bacteroidia bacterium]|nr:aspartate kinase [Bacteroidia bacterium]